jgi:GntR family transcriptional regulator
MTAVADQPLISEEKIDRDAYEPAYAQLANILRRKIAKGEFRPGDQLPSEAQLCRSYGISPMTVRRSINLLADEGVISTAQGRGTFVKSLEWSAAQFDLQELQNLFQDSENADIKLLDVRIVSANRRTARKLGLSPGDNVIYMRRLMTRDGQPLFYHRAYLIYDPKRPIVEAEMDATSLQGLFANGDNSLLKRGQLTIDATLMNEEEAKILQQSYPSAAFLLEHIFYDFADCPLSWGWFIFPSTHLRFTTQIGVDG